MKPRESHTRGFFLSPLKYLSFEYSFNYSFDRAFNLFFLRSYCLIVFSQDGLNDTQSEFEQIELQAKWVLDRDVFKIIDRPEFECKPIGISLQHFVVIIKRIKLCVYLYGHPCR